MYEVKRAQVIDYSDIPIDYEWTVIMIRTPGSELDNLMLFLNSFRTEVWLCTAGAGVLCCVVLWIVSRLSLMESSISQKNAAGWEGFRPSLFTPLRAIVYQGHGAY